MEKIHVLTQDNGSCNNNNKLSVKVPNSNLIHELRRFFHWRKDISIERLYREGSVNYDLFIKHLHNKGY